MGTHGDKTNNGEIFNENYIKIVKSCQNEDKAELVISDVHNHRVLLNITLSKNAIDPVLRLIKVISDHIVERVEDSREYDGWEIGKD